MTWLEKEQTMDISLKTYRQQAAYGNMLNVLCHWETANLNNGCIRMTKTSKLSPIQTNAGQDMEQRGLPFIPGPAEWYNHFERALSTLQSKESCSQET